MQRNLLAPTQFMYYLEPPNLFYSDILERFYIKSLTNKAKSLADNVCAWRFPLVLTACSPLTHNSDLPHSYYVVVHRQLYLADGQLGDSLAHDQLGI